MVTVWDPEADNTTAPEKLAREEIIIHAVKFFQKRRREDNRMEGGGKIQRRG